MLTELCGTRVPLAVASNTHTPRLRDQLTVAGLGHLADLVIGSDQVGHPKPAPVVYLAACERLGVSPSDAVALEDTSHGVSSAQAAGMRVVMVPGMHADARADWTVSSLEDPELVAWARSLGQA